jgi:hypothetical protein
MLSFGVVVVHLVVCSVALVVAGLTLFSGFGLGTLLLPAFALFFPLEVAVGATAVVHLANNLFKLALVGRHAHLPTVLRFGGPAVLASFAGAAVLGVVSGGPPVATYVLDGHRHDVTIAGAVVGTLIVGFALLDLLPRFDDLAFDARWLPVGGVLSGFFGGLSGHQGALRAAFLIKSGLTKEAFVGTGVVCAVAIDLARLAVYGAAAWTTRFRVLQEGMEGLLMAAAASAFLGSYVGARLVRKATLRGVRILVGVLLVTVGVLLASGIV